MSESNAHMIPASLEIVGRHITMKRIDDHHFIDAVHRTLFSVIKEPNKYRPDSRGLIVYLQMSAQRDFQNNLRKENRHKVGRIAIDSVELPPDGGNALCEGDGHLDAIMNAEEAAYIERELLPIVRDGLSIEECACLDLYLDGERRTEPYALALRIESLPIDEQRRRVKQVKDMLKKRIERGRNYHAD